MNKFFKSVLALGITSALGLSVAQAATYQVIDKGDVTTVKNSFAQQENNLGQMAISGTGAFNFPVQYQYLDEDDFDDIVRQAEFSHESVHALNDIEDEVALRAGQPTANDLAWVVQFLRAKNGNLTYQVVGDVVAMRNLGSQTSDFVIFDEVFPGTSTLTRSTVDYVNGITNDGWIYGNASAPYKALEPFTGSDGETRTYWVREFSTRAFFSPDAGDTIISLLPPTEGDDVADNLKFGGESAILDISENLFAVGYASTGIDVDALDFIFDETGGCIDPKEIEDDQPFEACVQQVLARGIYHTEAFKWTLHQSGITSAETLGHLVTPHEDDEREYFNSAQAINNLGVAVGYAHGWVDENEITPEKNELRSLYAVVYKNGEVKDFTEDHSEYYDSRAYDINDDGIAVGHVTTLVNGNSRTKFYYVDTNDFDTNMTMVFPTDFFNGSSSTARAINEQGVIVGEGEVETHNDSNGQTPRRTHGFMYDINSDTFTDLNAFLSCDSAYTIIEARDINDNNEVSASAIVKVPRRDAKGDFMLDENGAQLLEDVVRAVTLQAITGEIEDCSQVEEKVERQGAGIGYISILALLSLGFRRKFFKSKPL